MNAGLTSLMMHLINSGDDKKKQAEYEKRQLDAEERHNRYAIATEERQNRRDVARDALTTANKLKQQKYDEAKTLKQAEDKRQQEANDIRQGATAMHYLARPDETGKKPEWENLTAEQQAGIVSYYKGDPDKAAIGFSAMAQKLATAKTIAEVKAANANAIKSMAEANKAKDEITVGNILRPSLESDTLSKNTLEQDKRALETATILGGGASPYNAAQGYNRVGFDPNTGTSKVVLNPSRKLSEDEKLDAALSSTSNDGLNFNLPSNIFKEPTSSNVGANQLPIERPPLIRQPSAAPTPVIDQRSPVAPSREAQRFLEDVKYIQSNNAKPTTETVESLAEKYRREQEEFQKRYSLSPDYINQFSP